MDAPDSQVWHTTSRSMRERFRACDSKISRGPASLTQRPVGCSESADPKIVGPQRGNGPIDALIGGLNPGPGSSRQLSRSPRGHRLTSASTSRLARRIPVRILVARQSHPPSKAQIAQSAETQYASATEVSGYQNHVCRVAYRTSLRPSVCCAGSLAMQLCGCTQRFQMTRMSRCTERRLRFWSR